MKVVWSKRAEDRVFEIATFIAKDRPQAAVRWAASIFETVELLAEQPHMGKAGRDVATPGIRELVVGNYRIFYEVSDQIDIHTVRCGSELIDENELVGD